MKRIYVGRCPKCDSTISFGSSTNFEEFDWYCTNIRCGYTRQHHVEEYPEKYVVFEQIKLPY